MNLITTLRLARDVAEVHVVPVVVATLFLMFQAGVTFWLWRSETYLREQKINQTQLIWLLPFLGAVFVVVMLLDDYRHG